MAKAGTGSRKTRVQSLRHKDKRVNIPTEELRDFVAEEEKAPKKILYPRDPSLDPQLVWKGKDEQDAQPLEVPAVPIYIQEKIHPHAIIEDVLQTASGKREPQLDMFADFNGLQEGGLLPLAAELDEPDDPGRFVDGDDFTRREGRTQGQGPDDLPRPALRN
jgi:adenine-specific DNA-methyltransferase